MRARISFAKANKVGTHRQTGRFAAGLVGSRVYLAKPSGCLSRDTFLLHALIRGAHRSVAHCLVGAFTQGSRPCNGSRGVRVRR
jgi:hypothetical protein